MPVGTVWTPCQSSKKSAAAVVACVAQHLWTVCEDCAVMQTHKKMNYILIHIFVLGLRYHPAMLSMG
jgi:hypothetical protein